MEPGDDPAFQALLDAGFRSRSTRKVLDCCITAYPHLAAGGGGDISQVDHKTGHVWTDSPHRMKLVDSS